MKVHVDAAIERAKGDASAPLRVTDSDPADPTYPYVVVYAGGGIAWSDRECDERVRQDVSWQTTVVGASASQARAALDRLVARYENWTPAIPGWSCTKVNHDGSQPIQKDDSLPDRAVFYATDQWSFVADPA